MEAGRDAAGQGGRQGWVHAAGVASCRILSFSLSHEEVTKLHTGECEVPARSRLENIT